MNGSKKIKNSYTNPRDSELEKNYETGVKNLINGLAAIPSPFFLASEFLFSEYPKLKQYLDLEKNIGEIDKRLFTDGNYDGIELVLWGLFDEKWNIRQKRLEEYKKCKIPFYTYHACFEGISKRFKTIYLNLAERCDNMTKKAIKSHIIATSELSLGRTVIVFHPGTISCLNDKEKGFSNIINNLESALDLAREKDIILTRGWGSSRCSFCNEHQDLKHIIDKVNHPNLKVTFDWGHLNSCLLNKEYKERFYKNDDEIKTFKHIDDFVDSLGKDIIHSHIHYNRSHLNQSTNFREGILKKFVVYVLFWTNLSKFVRKGRNKNFYDEHLTLNRITNSYLPGFKNSILNLLEKTSIKDNGYITHEFAPRRVFKVFTYSKVGAEHDDYLKSLKIFKEIIKSNN
jgi:sugar phosphate isomerase/epimerase